MRKGSLKTLYELIQPLSQGIWGVPVTLKDILVTEDEICRTFDELMRGHPLGVIVIWPIPMEIQRQVLYLSFDKIFADSWQKPFTEPTNGPLQHSLILDGRSRLAVLYRGLMRLEEDLRRVRLFMNLTGMERGQETKVLFRFMTPMEVKGLEPQELWFAVSDILHFGRESEVMQYLLRHAVVQEEQQKAGVALDRLLRLYKIVYEDPIAFVVPCEAQSLDEVQEIYQRYHQQRPRAQATQMVFMQKGYDSQDQGVIDFTSLVAEMNHIWGWDAFDTDFVYLAALTLSGHDDLALLPSNLTPVVWERIQHIWPECRAALCDSLYLVSHFGFRPHSFPEKKVLIPIAVYLKTKQLPGDFITSLRFAFDRERILQWIIRCQLKEVFTHDAKGILLTLREIIAHDHEAFPIQTIIDRFTHTKATLTFSQAERDALLELEYTDPRVFSVLLLLYPDLDFQTTYYVDFIFPREGFRRELSETRTQRANAADSKVPNLHLGEGLRNSEKSQKGFIEWLYLTYPDTRERMSIMRKHYIPQGDSSPTAFAHFLQLRRQLLSEVLGWYLRDVYRARQAASLHDTLDTWPGDKDIAVPAVSPPDPALMFRRETMARAIQHYLQDSTQQAGMDSNGSPGIHMDQSQRPLKTDLNNQKAQALLEILKNSKTPLSMPEIILHMRKKGSTSGSYYDLLNSLVEDEVIVKQSSMGRHVYLYKGF
jgi:hypothetical protein